MALAWFCTADLLHAAPRLDRIQAPDSWNLSLFAAPTNVGYPACLVAAPAGEVFVGIDENGSLDRKPNRGRIVRCVDSDGDGQADRFAAVVPDIDSPRGLVWDGGKLYVLHPPDLSVFVDGDGDGAFERSEVLVKGIGFGLDFRGADHTSNGIQLGIDGWIYMAIGDYGFLDAEGRDGRRLRLRGGGVVRVRPDGTEMELVAEGLRNIYDVAISPAMDLFTRDNTNDGGGWNVRLSHLLELADYGYPRKFLNFGDEIMPALADYGGGSPCGSLFLDESHLPAAWQHGLFTCDWGRSVVYYHPMTPQGASFTAEQTEFVKIPRPTDMDIDGQGRLYISSWDGGQYTYGGPEVGYVVCLTPAASLASAFPDLAGATQDQLVQYLTRPSQVLRLHAQRELLRRGRKDSVERKLLDLSGGEHSRAVEAAVVFTLKQMAGSDANPHLIELAKQPRLREFALRALADRRSQMEQIPEGYFRRYLADLDPRVQRQAMLGVARLEDDGAATALLRLTVGEDRALAHTAMRVLVGLEAVEVCLSALHHPQSEPVEGALRVLRQVHRPAAVQGMIGLQQEATDAGWRAELLSALMRLYYREPVWEGGWWGTRPDTAGPYYERETWEESDRIKAAALNALRGATPELAHRLIEEMTRHRIGWPEAVPIMLRYAQDNASVKQATIRMLADSSDIPREALDLLRVTVVAEDAPLSLRADAFAALLQASLNENWGVLWQAASSLALREEESGEARRAVGEFLRHRGLAERFGEVQALAKQPDALTRELAFAALSQMSGRRSGAAENVQEQAEDLLRAAARNPPDQVPVLSALARTRRRGFEEEVRQGLASGNATVREAAERAARVLRIEVDEEAKGGELPVTEMRYEELVSTVAKAPGDAALGRELFERQLCSACHTVVEGDPPKGPFLGGIAERYNRFELTESILKPSAQIAQGFETHWFELGEEETVDGFVVREGGEEVEIRNAAGVALVLSKKDIRQRGTREASIMPEGLAANLSVQELASLLAFLESLGTSPP